MTKETKLKNKTNDKQIVPSYVFLVINIINFRKRVGLESFKGSFKNWERL